MARGKYKRTEEHRRRLSENRKGKHHSEETKRKMKNSPVIHHIDGNRKNNNPNNLIRIKRSEHTKLHRMQKSLMDLNSDISKKAIKKVIKVGDNSLMIVLPKVVCKRWNITEGDYIKINFEKVEL